MLACEVTGNRCSEAIDFLHELGDGISAITGDRRESTFLIQRLSVALQKGMHIHNWHNAHRASRLMLPDRGFFIFYFTLVLSFSHYVALQPTTNHHSIFSSSEFEFEIVRGVSSNFLLDTKN